MKRYNVAIDKLFFIIWIPVSVIMISLTILSFTEVLAFILLILLDLFVFYFLFSSLSGYVEIYDNYLYIKFGFIIKRKIEYKDIRDVIKERKVYSTSYLSLKNALEHIVIKYNKYDDVTISVKENDDLINELKKRIK